MEVSELVERLAAMRREDPAYAGPMTTVFGIIFCAEIRNRSARIAELYTKRWESDPATYPLKPGAKRLNQAQIQYGRQIARFVTVHPSLKHRWQPQPSTTN